MWHALFCRRNTLPGRIKYRYFPFFESLCHATLIFIRPRLVPVFSNWKNLKRIFIFMEKVKTAFNMCFCRKPLQWYHTPQAAEVALRSCINFGLCLWASVLYLDLFCAFFSKMCSKVPEKPNEAGELGSCLMELRTNLADKREWVKW